MGVGTGTKQYVSVSDRALLSMAACLGMEPTRDKALLWIARSALEAPLPAGWAEAEDDDGTRYFYERESGKTSWNLPSDDYYRQLFESKRDEMPRHTTLPAAGSRPATVSGSRPVSGSSVLSGSSRLAPTPELRPGSSSSAKGQASRGSTANAHSTSARRTFGVPGHKPDAAHAAHAKAWLVGQARRRTEARLFEVEAGLGVEQARRARQEAAKDGHGARDGGYCQGRVEQHRGLPDVAARAADARDDDDGRDTAGEGA